MKRVLPSALLLALILCAVPASAVEPVPNLVGKWTGSMEMHHKIIGFKALETATGVFDIKEQQGHTFHGVKTWSTPSGSFSETFSGVISADGKRLYITEHEEGIVIGDIISDTDIVFYYLEHGERPKAMYFEFKRVE